uniref:Cyclin-G-associated kinase-like n=1 Tax=Dermatophagoides pteronyssinus TaxID=6956 RepID=A0A6P6YA61_DERPT|nr:cyclin-G-associated kinase-like [Dermatophagoides pteronyssinus]
MNELFRNFGFASATASTTTTTETTANSSIIDRTIGENYPTNNPSVGDIVDIGTYHLRLELLIAEGGFGYVYQAKDLKTNKIYAIKRMISSDNESRNEIENEISILERIQTHRHIMEFYGYNIIKSNIYYLLCEHCGSGSLKDFKLPIIDKQLLNRIIFQLTLALEKLHQMNIIHRDIKIENILFDSNGFLKLCDFGSATDKSYKPNHDWTPMQRSLLEDEMNRHTTPMYRPPEILDTYLHYEINTSMDIWALGCLIFCLRFGQHPFEDSSKLRIINCKYTLPSTVNHQEPIIDLIKQCLQVNPSDRIDCSTILKVMNKNFVDLNSPCLIPKMDTKLSPTISEQPSTTTTNLQSPVVVQAVPGIAQSYFAGFTKYLKDTSSKVMQTVQNSIARQDLDMTFYTSRLLVMSYPAEGLESAYRNHIDDVRAVLESRDAPYLVVNISGRSYDHSIKFGPKIQVIDGGGSNNYWKDSKRIAPLYSIISLCDQIFKWMNLNNRNTIVIHCMDGKNNSSILTISFLILIGLFNDYHQALKFFLLKRNPLDLTISQYRYLGYITKLKKEEKYMDFFSSKKQSVIIRSIKMFGIPLFTKLRDGCRPFLELYSNLSEKIYSTFSDYEKLIQYSKGINEFVIWQDINVKFDLTTDLYLVIYHARSTISSKMLNQQKPTAIRITSLQFNLFFENNDQDLGQHKIEFNLTDLDHIEELDRFPFDFRIEIDYEIISNNRRIDNDCLNEKQFQSKINELEIMLIDKPECIFVDNREYEEFLELNSDVLMMKHDDDPREIKTDSVYTQQQSSLLVDTEKSSPIQNDIDFLYMKMNNINLLEECNNDNELTNNNHQEKTDLLVNLSFGESSNQENEQRKFSNDLLKSSNEIDLFSNNDDLYGNSKLTTDDLLNMDQSPDFDDKLVFPTTTTTTNSSLNPTRIGGGGITKMDSNLKSKNPSTPNLARAFDPFGDLNDYLNFSNNETCKSSIPLGSIPRVASFNNFPEDSKTNKGSATTTTTSASTTTNYQTKPIRPDYSRHNFDDIFSRTGLKTPRVNGNEFEDLLCGFKKTNPDNNNNANKTMAQIRKAEMLKSGANPIIMKVGEWTENKEKNIRALLCSLNTIVWDGCNWTPIGMHQLLTPNDVKKMYRKACLAIHPDKLVGSPHEELAKYIFMELNEAWSEFEKNPK